MDCLDHSAVIERLDRGKERLNKQDEAIEKHDALFRDLAVTMERVSTLNQSTAELLGEMKDHDANQDERIQAIEMQPASRYESLRGYLLSGLIGALFGAMPQIIGLLR